MTMNFLYHIFQKVPVMKCTKNVLGSRKFLFICSNQTGFNKNLLDGSKNKRETVLSLTGVFGKPNTNNNKVFPALQWLLEVL